MGSTLIRICALCAILAGVLRAISSFNPETTPNAFLLYMAIDLCLLLGVVGLYRFSSSSTKLVPLLGSALMFFAVVVLIGRDLSLARSSIYAGAAATFSVGLNIFAIHLLRDREVSIWIPIAWLLSTIVGPLGFFVPQLPFPVRDFRIDLWDRVCGRRSCHVAKVS